MTGIEDEVCDGGYWNIVPGEMCPYCQAEPHEGCGEYKGLALMTVAMEDLAV